MEPTIVELRYRHSAELGELFSALAIAQGEMEHAAKDSVNPHFRSKYADLAAAVDAARPALAKNGLAVLQPPCSVGGSAVSVLTVLGHKSGQWWLSELTMTAKDSTPQSIGSAITYGRRYGFMGMLSMASEDDDGNSASGREPRESQAAVAERRIAEEPQRVVEQTAQHKRESASGIPSVETFRTAQKFEKLKIFKDAKNRLAELTQSNETYYTILGAHGAEHASEFKTVGDAVSCWKEMRAVLEMREVEKGAVNV